VCVCVCIHTYTICIVHAIECSCRPYVYHRDELLSAQNPSSLLLVVVVVLYHRDERLSAQHGSEWCRPSLGN